MLNLDLSLYKGSALLKDWWKQVKENFTQTQSQVNSLHVTLTNETTSRTNADLALSDRIDNLSSDRLSADNALSARIDAEISAREGAVSSLSSDIFTEQVARQNSFGALLSQINDEKTARENADSALSSSISTERSDRIGACDELNDHILELYDSSHTHENMSVLSLISSAKVTAWNGAVTGCAANARSITSVTSDLSALADELRQLLSAFGNNVFDGGDFRSSQTDDAVDGGIFTEEPVYAANFGTFTNPMVVTIPSVA